MPFQADQTPQPPEPKQSRFVADQPVKDSGLMGATTDVLNRGLVASTLGAPVDIAAEVMRPFGYKEKEPFLGSEYIGKQMEKAGMVSPKRRPVAEMAVGLAPSLVTGGVAGARAGTKAIGKLIGGGRDLAEELRATTAGKTAQEIAAAEKKATTAEKRIGATEKIAEREAKKGEAAYEQLPGVTTTTEAGVKKSVPQAEADIGTKIRDTVQGVYDRFKATRQANAEKNKADCV